MTKRRKRTAVRMVVDESGSMGHVQHETVAGYRDFLDSLRATPADVRVSLDIFDNVPRTVYENEYLERADGLDGERAHYDAHSGGGTALWDAFGDAIDRQAKLAVEDDHIIMAVITDGYDTDSTRYTHASIKAKVAEKRATGKWEFIWLGPNQKTAEDLGIKPENVFVLSDAAGGIAGALAQVAERTETLLLGPGTADSGA